MNVREYFEALSTSHVMVQHSAEEPHFACSIDDAATLMARRLHYPAVFLNEGDIIIGGSNGNELTEREHILAFVQHVRDAGDIEEVAAAFDTTETIMRDFLAKMVTDKQKGIAPVARFSAIGSEAHRVELAEAGLYGWMLFFNISSRLCILSNNENFDDIS